MPISQHPQHNPGRGVVRSHEHPEGKLIDAATGKEIKDWLWADLDAGEYRAYVRDDKGAIIVDTPGSGPRVVKVQTPLSFEQRPATPVTPLPQEVPASPAKPAGVSESSPQVSLIKVPNKLISYLGVEQLHDPLSKPTSSPATEEKKEEGK